MALKPKDQAEIELCARVAKRIREARIVAGLTPLQVVEAANLSKSTYYLYESAEGSFQITILARIASVVGCTLAELVMTDEEIQEQLAAKAVSDAAASLVTILTSHQTDRHAPAPINNPSHAWRELLSMKHRAAFEVGEQTS